MNPPEIGQRIRVDTTLGPAIVRIVCIRRDGPDAVVDTVLARRHDPRLNHNVPMRFRNVYPDTAVLRAETVR